MDGIAVEGLIEYGDGLSLPVGGCIFSTSEAFSYLIKVLCEYNVA